MKQPTFPEHAWFAALGSKGNFSDVKKREIVEATVHIIATQGIESLTFESVGKSLHTTKANIRYHFHDKDELIFIATRLVVSNAQLLTARLVEESPTPSEKLNAVIFGAYKWFKDYPEHFKTWAMYFYYSTIFPNYMKVFAEARETGQKRMAFLLRTLPRASDARAPHYEKAADAVQNFITGQLIALAADKRQFDASLADTRSYVSVLLASEGIIWP